jgi:hypothetical protein
MMIEPNIKAFTTSESWLTTLVIFSPFSGSICEGIGYRDLKPLGIAVSAVSALGSTDV